MKKKEGRQQKDAKGPLVRSSQKLVWPPSRVVSGVLARSEMYCV